MLKVIFSLIILFSLSVLTACSPFDKFVFKSGGYGMITEGSEGIVWIGQDFEEAERNLVKKGLLKNISCYEKSSSNGGLFRDHKVPTGAVECCFDDVSWRRGTLCISNRDGKVASIAWAYQPGPDF